MRTLLIALLLFIVFHIVKEDLTNGTIPMASFFETETSCPEQKLKSITVRTVDGDTIESLLSLYPDPGQTFMERLSSFYELNPHLQNQKMIGGLEVKLPVPRQTISQCE